MLNYISDVAEDVPVEAHSNLLRDSLDPRRHLIPVAIDIRAVYEPQAVFCSLPYDDDDLSKGYEDITFATFATAINKMAWIIHDTFGPSHQFDTIMYMGKPDVRYQIVQMAVVKAGYRSLFSSHMNSLAGHVGLMDQTNAKILLSAEGVKIDDILASRPMKHRIIPELDELLRSGPVKDYPYHKTFEEGKHDPCVVLHTSGTTGLPKPVNYTLGLFSAIVHPQFLPDIDPASGLLVRKFFGNAVKTNRIVVPFLHFHAISSAAAYAAAVYSETIWIPGFRHRMAATSDIPAILKYSKPNTAFFSPAMVEDLAKRPDVGEYISCLEKCLYGGAAITEAAGKTFSKYTYLQSQWGITETMKVVDIEPEPEDFAYCAFDLKNAGITFEPAGDGLCEMVVRRTPDSYPNIGFFWRCPNETIFKPGDLWSPHPDPKKAKFLWKYEGRTDDMISWKDGTNLRTVEYEGKHSEHEWIRSALMAGTGHRQPVLLLELYPQHLDQQETGAAIEKLWKECVKPVNELAPTNGQVAKSHIIIVSPEKPFDRNVKGTVARNATLRKYNSEIEAIYQQFGDETVKPNERFAKH